MSVKCFEDEKHYIVETANWCLDATTTAAEAVRKYAWNTSPKAHNEERSSRAAVYSERSKSD